MKKIIFLLTMLLCFSATNYAQVQVGNGTNELQNVPIEPFYGYTYSQSIYLASEIGATGSITSISVYFSGTSTLPNSKDIVLYMAHTAKTSFTGVADFVPVASLTQVYLQTAYANPVAPGWITFTLTTPFAYNGTDNLIVAFDENTPSYDSSTDDFYNTAVTGNRSVYFYQDDNNVDPANPQLDPDFALTSGTAAFVPNIIFGGIAQACPTPSLLVSSAITAATASVSWTEATGATLGYEYYLSTNSAAPSAASTISGTSAAKPISLTGLMSNTQYYIAVRRICSVTEKSTWSSMLSFKTPCVPITILPWAENFDALTPGTNVVPNCWALTNITSDWSIATGQSAYSGANVLRRTWSTDGWAFMPIMTLESGKTYNISYFVKTNAYTGTEGYDILLAAGNAQNIAAMTTTINSTLLYLSPTWSKLSYSFVPASTGNYSFGLKVSGTFAPNGINFDDFKVAEAATCPEPTALIVTGITSSGGQVDWTEPTTPAALGYDYIITTTNVFPATTATPTGSVLAGNNSAIFSGLMPGTNYFVWVRSKCSLTDIGPWSDSAPFLTNCADAITFTQNFDAALTFPDCWKKLGPGGSATITATGSQSTPNALTLSSSGITVATQGLVVMPPVSNAGAGTYRLRFRARGQFTLGGVIQVGYLADNYDGSTFVPVQSFTTTSTTVYDTFSAELGTAPGTNKFLAFRHAGAPNTNTVLIDDVSWELTPNCVEPTLVVSSSLTSAGATITWTEPLVPAALGYEYFVGTTNTLPGAASVATGSVAGGISTKVITGLSSNTTYFVWVRGVCSASSKSPWSSSATFKTLCNADTVPTALVTVEGTTGTNLPDCWSSQLISGTDNWVGYTPSGTFDEISTPVSGTRVFRKNYNSSEAILSSNALNYTSITTPTRVSLFLQRSTSAHVSDQYKVFVNTAQSLSGATEILNISLLNSVAPAVATKGFYKYIANIPVSFHGQPIVFVLIQGITAGDFSSYSLGIDDFKVELVPTCIEPTALTLSGVTNTTATVSWTAPTVVPGNGYEYFLSTSNVAPNAASVATGSTAAGVTTISFIGLPPSTAHYVWVRSVCSASDTSAWSVVAGFTTLCDAVATFTQNFDGTTVPCWLIVGNSGTVSILTSNGFSAPNCLLINSPSATLRAVISMPPVTNAAAGTHWLRFKARSRYTFSLGGVIEVGYLTNPSDATSFVSLQSFTTTSGTVYNNFTAFLGSAPTANSTLAFRHSGVPANEVLIDDVTWEALPTCAEPTGLVASNVLSGSATVSWTASASLPANGYEYFVSSTNTAPSAAATPTGATAAGVTSVNLATSPTTNYFVWVRSVCSASEKSIWTLSPLAFTTPCAVFTTLNQNFATFPPSCFNFAGAGTIATGPTGTAAGSWVADGFLNVGTTGSARVNLYQSNNSNWMISPMMDLTSGNYTFSFNYGLTAYAATTTSAMGSDDSVRVLITTNGGTTWSELTVFNAASNVPNTSTTYSYLVPAASSTSTVRFALLASDGTVDDIQDYDFFIDDLKVEAALSNSTFDNASFSYYPNPVKGILNLDYNQNITNVAVYNLLGQQVITKTVNANQSKIDMSNLSAGTYLVKVTADNQTKTIKVIKE